MPIAVDFRLSKIVIIESLESHEVKTGTLIAEMIHSLEVDNKIGLSVDYVVCESAGDFREILNRLTQDALATKNFPLLHIECHGDAIEGLQFQNGSLLSWQDLSETLLLLNRATRFNLLAIFSACYGAHFLSKIESIDPAPCYAMIAPTDSIKNYEILAGFRTFYSALFKSSNAGVAVDAMLKLDLEEGGWFVQQAELWFERVAIGYVTTHCTKSEMKRRALRMQQKLKLDGTTAKIGQLKTRLVELNRSNLSGEFFDIYFMCLEIPENTSRFHSVRDRLNQKLAELRRTGQYGI